MDPEPHTLMPGAEDADQLLGAAPCWMLSASLVLLCVIVTAVAVMLSPA